eukprot:scaffold164781_cov22-Tisochrysis_lutea.AAC.1
MLTQHTRCVVMLTFRAFLAYMRPQALLFCAKKALLYCAKKVVMPHNGEPTQIRVGIHTGPAVTGLIGTKLPKYSVFGDTMMWSWFGAPDFVSTARGPSANMPLSTSRRRAIATLRPFQT